MSIWGKLAGLAGIVAAPFTAGTSLSWVPAAFGAGAAVDGMAGGGGNDGDGGGMDLGSAWGDDGTFTGDSTFGSVQDDGGGQNGILKLALKYGLPALAGAIKSGQMNSQAQQQLQLLRQKLAEETAARKQTAALDESKLDPFRSQMAQARDVGKLDMQAEGNFSSGPVQLDAKYGRGMNLQPEQFYNPSPIMRAVARGSRDSVAAGTTMPTMTDPANYGKTAVGNYSAAGGAAAPGGAPSAGPSATGAPATAILAALRAKGVLPDDTDTPSSPWLTA